VWVESSGMERNVFVRFERCFVLTEKDKAAILHLFADTRYRLWINGHFVQTGPGRFVTAYPEYDTVSLADTMRAGENVIVVEVNYFGAPSYQHMPDSRPGFIAAGCCGGHDLGTPGAWTARRMSAWSSEAPLYSFAQSPVEICDTRLLDIDKPAAPVVCREVPWGPLKPFSGIPLPFDDVFPRRLEVAGALSDDERRVGFVACDPEAEQALMRDGHVKPWIAFQTWLWSPNAQIIRLGCFWSDLFFNGVPVPTITCMAHGNRGYTELDLSQGWSRLSGRVEVLTSRWSYLLGIPRASGVTLHATRDRADPRVFYVTQETARDVLTNAVLRDEQRFPEGYAIYGDAGACAPARMMGWDALAPGAVRHVPIESWHAHASRHARAATWCFSFAGEYLGHTRLEVEAPAGSVLDVAYDDWQAESGMVALYQSHPFTDSADRYILRGGRQVVEGFHPRGGKFLQITLRVPATGGPAPLTLHDVRIRSRQVWSEDQTRFTCDHAALTWAWPVSFRTLTASTEDAFTDCPWRERGSYIDDVRVSVHLNLLLNHDLRVARRTLLSFAQAPLPDGQLPCCAPSWLRKPHDDFTLTWIMALHDYWALTGDTACVRACRDALEGIWNSSSWETEASSGLWNLVGRRPFFDWGILASEREGEAHAGINLLRIEAARHTAVLLRALGDEDAARAFEAMAARVTTSLFACLWDEQEGRFYASRHARTPALHANALAIAYEIGTPNKRNRILAYIEPMLRANLVRGLERGPGGGHMELVCLFPLLTGLARHGRPDLAEQLIEDHYGYLQALGDDTLPECFCLVRKGGGSRCHSWSGAPAVYAARYVLGLRPAIPGNVSQWIWDPVVHGITQARGRIAHKEGWLDVEWERTGDKLTYQLQGPPGVEFRARDGSALVSRGIMQVL